MSGPRPRQHRRRGSVYLITLVVLLVLSVLALAISLITQSEMQIGVNERLDETMLYAAGSGIELATAKALVIPDLRPVRIDRAVDAAVPGLNLRNRVEVSDFLPILDSPCDLCQINHGEAYARLEHQVRVTASRVGWLGAAEPVPAGVTRIARKRLELTIAFEPWPRNTRAMVYASGSFNETSGPGG